MSSDACRFVNNWDKAILKYKIEEVLNFFIGFAGAYLENLQTGSRRGIFFSKIFAGCL